MLVSSVSSSTNNEYSAPINDSHANRPPSRVRIRTLHVCEPSYPSREIVRRENYIRRQTQQQQGWTCPAGVPYQGIDPVHLPPKPWRSTENNGSNNVLSGKSTSRLLSSATGTTGRPRSGSVAQQDENTAKVQYETTMRRLQTAEQKHLKKSNEILKSVQLGHSIKDIVERFPRPSTGRVESIDGRGPGSVVSDDKDSEVMYDRLLDDFEEDDDTDGSSVSDIRDDIMSPRTVTNTNMTSTATGDAFEMPKIVPTEISAIPMKLCQSAPPLNRSNIRQATLRPFTPRYSSLSARLRLTRHMPFRDALYRQLCCILWLLRAMARPDWSEMLSGCWNIDQWLRNESRSHAHRHHHHHQQQQQMKKQQDTPKSHPPKQVSYETKPFSINQNQKENVIAPSRPASLHADSLKRQQLSVDSHTHRLSVQSSDDPSGRRSAFSDASERFDLQLNSSMNNETDLNESGSSKSNQGDGPESSVVDNSQPPTINRSVNATPALVTTTTSRTSMSTVPGQLTSRGLTGRLTAIMERRRSPDVLLKKWSKSQKITVNDDSNEPLPLTDTQIRLLRVGDNEDLKRIFGLENIPEANKDPVRERHTREIERKLVTNVKRRPMTSIPSSQSRRHAQILSKIKRDFNDFTEEQSIILNNKLDQVDNERLFYCQTKLRELELYMPPLTILDRLLKRFRVDDDKKKTNAAYLKYQPWYVDLLRMVQPDYTNDPVILLLLKEMEDYASPADKPTVIRFKAVLGSLRSHEICHPDVMAAIEFVRIHILRMNNEDFDKFFMKQFPTVTKYLTVEEPVQETNETKSVA